MMAEPAKQPAREIQSPVKPKGMFAVGNYADRISKADMPTPKNNTPSKLKNMFTIENDPNRLSKTPAPISNTSTPTSNTPTPKAKSPLMQKKMLTTENESSPMSKKPTPVIEKDMKDPIVRTVRVLKLLETRATNIANRLSEQPELQQELHMLSRDIGVVNGFLSLEAKGT